MCHTAQDVQSNHFLLTNKTTQTTLHLKTTQTDTFHHSWLHHSGMFALLGGIKVPFVASQKYEQKAMLVRLRLPLDHAQFLPLHI